MVILKDQPDAAFDISFAVAISSVEDIPQVLGFGRARWFWRRVVFAQPLFKFFVHTRRRRRASQEIDSAIPCGLVVQHD